MPIDLFKTFSSVDCIIYIAKFLYIFPLAGMASTEYTSQIYKLYICFY